LSGAGEKMVGNICNAGSYLPPTIIFKGLRQKVQEEAAGNKTSCQ